ncbi:MAG: hypothetical protein ACREET_02260 [Stellaceae bacterium]
MLLVDGQVHLWEKGTPSPPHRQERVNLLTWGWIGAVRPSLSPGAGPSRQPLRGFLRACPGAGRG